MTMSISLSGGLDALVDDADFAWLSAHSWRAASACGARGRLNGHEGYYAVRYVRVGRRNKAIFMHRLIAAPPTNMVVDHIDRNTLNNQRSNLRIATGQQNSCNRFHRSRKSGMKGVEINKRRFRARIVWRGMRYYLGAYELRDQAAVAYDVGAVAVHGDFAALNFPDHSPAPDLVASVHELLRQQGALPQVC